MRHYPPPSSFDLIYLIITITENVSVEIINSLYAFRLDFPGNKVPAGGGEHLSILAYS